VRVSYNQARLRRLNGARLAAGAEYVLYWMQSCRRLERSHALDYALRCAAELGRPLVLYEGLRIDYPWASERLHRFVLEGMQANAARAGELGLSYWPYVESRAGEGRGLLRRLSERACLVVTDDFPCFIVPAQAEALAQKASVPVFAVD
jgi:deoxyribodipyrimidine photo-lyase